VSALWSSVPIRWVVTCRSTTGRRYGTWPYPDLSPYDWYPSGFVPGAYAAGAIGFTAAAVVGSAICAAHQFAANRGPDDGRRGEADRAAALARHKAGRIPRHTGDNPDYGHVP